jgi:hypothetical protein
MQTIHAIWNIFKKSLTKLIERTARSEPPQAKAMGPIPPDTVSVEILHRIRQEWRSIQTILSQYKKKQYRYRFKKNRNNPENIVVDPALILYQQLSRSGG